VYVLEKINKDDILAFFERNMEAIKNHLPNVEWNNENLELIAKFSE